MMNIYHQYCQFPRMSLPMGPVLEELKKPKCEVNSDSYDPNWSADVMPGLSTASPFRPEDSVFGQIKSPISSYANASHALWYPHLGCMRSTS
jgi:hypothetical protein